LVNGDVVRGCPSRLDLEFDTGVVGEDASAAFVCGEGRDPVVLGCSRYKCKGLSEGPQ
jgi:hypothetical protein